MKKDNKGEDMAEFKFVKRENELETITKSYLVLTNKAIELSNCQKEKMIEAYEKIISNILSRPALETAAVRHISL